MKRDSEKFLNRAVDHIPVGDGVFALARPADVDSLIESGAGIDDLGDGIKMPYWASLWPVSRALAARVIRHPQVFKDRRVLELGCGLGLPGLAASRCGAILTFSDYDEDALRYARHNAELNGFHDVGILKMDWKFPLDLTFDVIIGSDLAWTPDVVPHFTAVMSKMLAPAGTVWLADQNRVERSSFEKILASSKLEISHAEVLPLDESWGWNIGGTFYEIQRSGGAV